MPESAAVKARLSPLAWLLLACSVLWCLCFFIHALGYCEDDAFIHLEFARSVANGQGFAFNGHVVYGDTSPAWVFLLVAVHTIVPGWIADAKILSAAAILFSSAGAFFLAFRLTRNTVFAATMVLLFVANPYFSYWAYSGMETIAAAGLAFLAAALITGPTPGRGISWPSFFAVALMVGIGPILRPELVFLSAILGIILIQRWLLFQGSLMARVTGLLGGLALAVGPTLAWSMYALRVFGNIVPNTNAAKRAPPQDSILVRLAYVYGVGYPVISVVLLAGLIYLVIRAKRSGRTSSATTLRTIPLPTWIFFLWSAITALFYVVNHTHVQTRYLVVTASGLSIVVLALLASANQRWFRIVTLLTLLFGVGVSVGATWPLITVRCQRDQIYNGIAHWMDTSIPSDAPVAVYFIGQLAFASQHPIVDTGGITRASSVGVSSSGLVEWARSQGAVYYISDEKQPEAGAVQVFNVEAPQVDWLSNAKRSKIPDNIIIWKLPATPPAVTR